jgi:2-oxo-4-hydroxy-4-carboxy-5-ureidoimidazoline decarboxylase
MNASYKTKFDFPFLFAVRGSDKFQILAALEERLESPPEAEFRKALNQVYRIARFRLEDIVE